MLNNAGPRQLPPLIVHSDPMSIGKILRRQLVVSSVLGGLFTLLAVFIASLNTSAGPGMGFLSPMPILIPAAYMLFLAGWSAYALGQRTTSRTVLVLDADGLHGTLPQGEWSATWQNIGEVKVRRYRRGRQVLSFVLVPGTTAESPGVRTTLSSRNFGYISKRGFRIGSAGIDIPIQHVANAAAALTNGRLLAR